MLMWGQPPPAVRPEQSSAAFASLAAEQGTLVLLGRGDILVLMDQNQAIEKARRFARNAYEMCSAERLS